MATNLSAGSIAFTGFNADGNDNLAFVVLEDIAAGTVINFTDNAWNGSAFTTAENHWSWTADGDVAAGTVVTMDDLATTSPTSNSGSIAYSSTATRDLADGTESVFAYVGEASSPTFLTAISNNGFTGLSTTGRLTNTGLVLGTTAINLGAVDGQADIGVYVGPRESVPGFSDFLSAINNPANWITQDAAGNQSADGVAPDAPFSTAPFEADPSTQLLSFAPESVTVSQVEGDAGTTTVYTFTVQRTNGTTGEVNFSGTLTPGTNLDATDFGGTLPATFSGTIADGATTGTVSISVSGDITKEADESFKLTLTGASNTENGVFITGQTQATGAIVNDDTLVQTLVFDTDATHVEYNEGPAGTTHTYTFTVVRAGDDVSGNLTFTARVWGGFSSPAADAADFDGTWSTITGVIPDGQTSGTISIVVAGDNLIEGDEPFQISLEGGITDTGIAAVPDTSGRFNIYGTILNDDLVVHSGEAITTNLTLTGNDHLVVENGGSLTAANYPITLSGENLDVVIDNHGLIGGTTKSSGTIRMLGEVSGSLTVNNHADGKLTGDLFHAGTGALDHVTINNDGLMDGGEPGIVATGAVVNNSSTGIITTSSVKASATLTASVVNNYGQISGPDAVIAGEIHNYAGGLIHGGRHAATGSGGVTVINDAGARMIGDNGSAVNIDNDSSEARRVHVTNYGIMEGGQTGTPGNIDGDAVDVDGLLTLENYGRIAGLGAQGYHDGEANVSEGIAIGGGTINNYAGGEIYGYGRAIEIDNSSNSDAFATATIYNEGLIQGDGHLPTAVSEEDIALFAERIKSGEAINIEGTNSDTLTNTATGRIIGGVKMGGGDDIVVNKGSMTATGGSAVNLGDGDDTFEAHADSTVTGLIDGGDGNDTLKLLGTGVGTLGANANFETLDVRSGMWAIESDAYDAVNVAAGAMVTSQLRLADHGEMNVAAGGTVLTTDGSDAVVADGSATINNSGLIQALGMQGTTAAQAISLNGGEVYTTVGSLILAQGVAIASTDAPDPGVTIVNDGMIRSLSDEAIILAGDAGDLLVNTRSGSIVGKISTGGGNDLVTNQGSVVAAGGTAFDLGDGNDTLNLHDGSTVVGQILLGAGNDVMSSQSASDLVIDAGAGQDSIATGDGNDRISGGAGIDLIHAGGGNDIVAGGADNDQLRGGDGDDRLSGDAGDDYLEGGNGNDVVLGGDGNDEIHGNDGDDNLQGGAGIDTIRGGAGNDRINGGSSADVLYGDAGQDTIYGSDGNDEIHGGADNDQLHGEGGNDTIYGDAGNDTFYGGIGQDKLIGGEGNDQIYGQDGDDTLIGGAGFDKLHGGAGVDTADYSQDGEAIYTRLDQGWAMAQADRVSNWTDLVAGIKGNTIEHDDLIEIENITGTAFNDAIVGNSGDNVIKGGAGNDLLAGLGGNDTIYGGEGNDRITAGAGDQIHGDQGNDTIEVAVQDGAPASVDGGDGDDTVKLLGNGVGAFGQTTNVETLDVAAGTWTASGTASYDAINIAAGATLASQIEVEHDMTVTVGGTLVVADDRAITAGDGLDDGSSLTVNVLQGGSIIAGDDAIRIKGNFKDGTVSIDNAGLIQATGGQAIDLTDVTAKSTQITIVNQITGVITAVDADAVRGGGNTVIDNYGRITSVATGDDVNDGIDFQDDGNGTVTNHTGASIIGAHHGITGAQGITVVNEVGGTISGQSGSAVNIDSDGSVESTVNVINRGIMLGNADDAQSDSDGDAVDVDGLVKLDNHGQVRGTGAHGYHDGTAAEDANISEGVAAGGGMIHNYAGATIYGYGRAIQIDNSSNGGALASTTIVNDGLIQGGGHGPEGVNPDDAAAMQARIDGAEAINILGTYNDSITNTATGQIIGGIFTDGGNDSINNDGTITAINGNAVSLGAGDDFLVTRNTITGNVDMGTGADEVILTSGGHILGTLSFGDDNDKLNNSGELNAGAGAVALDMGTGDDWVNLYVGTTVQGSIQLGSGNDFLSSTAGGGFTIDAGEGDDQIYLSSMVIGGDDVVDGGAGDDMIYAGLGDDQLHGGAGNDTLAGENGSDTYTYSYHDGDDVIREGAGEAGDIDSLVFTEYGDGPMTLYKHGNDLVIEVENDGTITVTDQFAGGGIENISFDNGFVWDRDDILEKLQNRGPTAENVTLPAVNEDAQTFVISFDKLLEHASDMDLDKLVVNGLADVVGGTAELTADGVKFTLDPNFNGEASFGFTVDDGRGGTTVAHASFDVTPVNDAPIVVDDAGQAGEDDIATFDLVHNDTDVENGQPHLTDFTVTGVDGDLAVSPEAAASAFHIVNGQLVYDGSTDVFGDLNDGQSATVTVAYTATDDDGAATNGQFVLTIDGATDLNVISGTDNTDLMFDTAADDHIVGGDGGDVIFTSSGADLVDAGNSNDIVTALTGNATVNAGDGNDTLIGGFGNTVLNGDAGNDTIIGGFGNEVLNGGAGNDMLIATGGNDRVIGGQGNDLLIGGLGSDTFVFKAGDGQDTVLGFQASGTSHDVIEVDADAFADFNAVMAAMHDTGVGAQLQYADGSTMTLAGVAKDHLVVNDFHFA